MGEYIPTDKELTEPTVPGPPRSIFTVSLPKLTTLTKNISMQSNKLTEKEKFTIVI